MSENKVSSSFSVGEKVLYRNHFKNEVRWIPARIVEVVSRHTYKIEVHSAIRFVQENQIRKSGLEDRFHPNVRVCPKLSHQDEGYTVVSSQLSQSPKSSPNASSPDTSQEFKTPQSSPTYESKSAQSSPTFNSNISGNSQKGGRKVRVPLSEGSSRSGSTSTSEEEGIRRSGRATKPTERFNSSRLGN